MEELLRQVAAAQQLTAFALAFIVFLDFLAVCIAGWVVYISRGIAAETSRVAQIDERVAAMLKEMREDSKRMEHYLFVKLGPAELK